MRKLKNIKVSKKAKIFGVIFAILVAAAIPTTLLIMTMSKTTDSSGHESLPDYVRLEITTDTVMVRLAGSEEYQPGVEGMEITAGSSIKTDENGRAQVIYPNGSSTRIDINSEMTIQEYTKAPFNVTVSLSLGRIWNRVAKLLGNESYQTVSPSVVATVRGTSYGHSLRDTFNDIEVVRGAVVSTCLNKTQIAEVTENKKGSFDCNQKAPAVAEMTDDDKNDEWVSFNEEEDSKLIDMFGGSIYGDLRDDEMQSTDSTSDDFGSVDETVSPSSTPSSDIILNPDLYLSPDLMKMFSPTPTPTPSYTKTYDTNLNLDSSNLKMYSPTPTPTPTPTVFGTFDSTKTLDTNLKIYTPTPTPTPTPTLQFNTNYNLQLITPTPTPTPLIKTYDFNGTILR